MSNQVYYIQDTRQVVGNCLMFWREGNNGYTYNLDEAGMYTLEEAEKICRNRASDRMLEKSYVDSLAERHVDIQDLVKEVSQ